MNNINRRRFLNRMAGTAVALVWPHCTSEARTASVGRQPNIIVILADDLGYGDLSCYGSERNKTPHLDALAAGGVRFTDFHSSGAVCSPTRAGLLTGRYQQRCGITDVLFAAGDRNKGLPASEITFARQLKAAGYATALFGKWHLGYSPKSNPVRFGFDRFRGYVSGNVDYISHVDSTGAADWWANAQLAPEEGYTTHLITKHAVRFIENNKDRPFCLYVAHEAVHSPYQGPSDPAIRQVGSKATAAGRPKNIAAKYAEMLGVMDEGIGQIAAALRRLDLERETFIFFFSDNGATNAGSNGPLHGFKSSLWEGGHRVPAMACWPGKIAPRLCDEPTICLDLFPTFLALANAEPPKDRPLDGVNLLPLLTEGKPLGERTLFWAAGQQRAVRQGPWKLLMGIKDRGNQPGLFNLPNDLSEKQSLADKEPQRVQAMRTALGAWEREVMPGGGEREKARGKSKKEKASDEL